MEHTQKETAKYFYLSVNRRKSTEKPTLDNVWLGLPWWY